MNVKWVGIACMACGERAAWCRGLCKRCYARLLRRKKGMRPNLFYGTTECRDCGRTPVKALGLCGRCYDKLLEQKHPERRHAQKHAANEKRQHGQHRDEVTARAGGRCEICGMSSKAAVAKWGRKMDIHHRDGKGRTSAEHNHAVDNLMLVCPSCHRRIHKVGLEEAKRRASCASSI